MLSKIKESVDYIQQKIIKNPTIGMILGTGLSSFADILEDTIYIPYSSIPHFPISTAPSHRGQIVFGKLADRYIIIMQGRFHFYEGYSMEKVTYPIRVIQQLGINELIITNAAGSLNSKMIPGTIVLIKDHINFMGTNPLIGKNLDEFGERFPSMHEPYNKEMMSLFINIAGKKKILVQEGVYTAVSGPSLETNAECIMLQRLGSDLVGMSTVPEVIVGVHCGLKILGISIVTNLSNIFHADAHSQQEIQENATKATKHLQTILIDFLSSAR